MSTTHRLQIVGASALLVITIGAYAPAISGGFVWDDDAYVSANATLRSLDGLRRIWLEPGAVAQYYPLTYTTFWLEYRLWGLNTAGYHAVNIVTHLANALLLWWALRRLRVNGAWVAAAVFAVHPVHVESVAWITERKNVLSGLFYLLTLHLYFAARPLDMPESARVGWMAYGASLAAFGCALLSKSVVASLPLVLLLLAWWKRGRVAWGEIALIVPFLAMGLALMLPSMWLEKHHVSTVSADFNLSWLERALVAGRALWFYAGKLYWPHPLMFGYPRWQVQSAVWWQYVFPLAAAAVPLALLAAQSWLGRGPVAAVLFFAGTLVPALGFVDVYFMRYSFVADHFEYLASIGLIALTVGTAATGLRSWTPRGREILPVVFTPLILILAGLTWHQTHIYADRETLWRDTLRKNPTSWIAHNNLGSVLLDAGRTDEAMRHLEAARRIKENSLTDMGLALGLAAQGHTQEAVRQARVALSQTRDDPRAYLNVGAVAARAGDWAQAAEAYSAAVRLKPDYLEARRRLGDTLLSLERADEAREQYAAVLRYDPAAADVYDHLGVALTMQRRFDEAVQAFTTALQLKPDLADAHNHWGVVLSMQGRSDEAIGHYREALRHDPTNADAQYNLHLAESAKPLTVPHTTP